ncbi:MAG: dihydroorotase [Nitrospirota bacterium]
MDKPIVIKNGALIDPSQGIEGIGDIIIERGRIAGLSMKNGRHEGGEARKRGKSEMQKRERTAEGDDAIIIDAKGMVIIPGLVDMHTHLREPGFEHKETIRTGTLAALRGGFTTVCAMPNTSPVNDNPTVTAFMIKTALKEGVCTVLPIGAITKGQKGEELAEMGLMYDAGCIAFSDDGRPVMSSIIMRRALEYSRIFGVPIISHCEDLTLTDAGHMNEGPLCTMLGLKGLPAAAEEVMVARDILLAELTGGKLHIAHVSTEGSVRLIRQAKERSIAVTAETCPHYFSITEDAVKGYNTNAKVNPPLRTQRDVDAIREGLRDGTLDVIATDHAPHHRDEKLLEFDKAPPGISGLETALSLSLRLVEDKVLSMHQLVEKMSLNPARILGLDRGTLRVGADADVVIVDTGRESTIDARGFASMGKNSPFDGWTVKGVPVMTIWKGQINKLLETVL